MKQFQGSGSYHSEPFCDCKNKFHGYPETAKSSAEARLRPEDRRLLDELVDDLHRTPSEIVREGLRLVRQAHPTIAAERRMIGAGKLQSGSPDWATNKKPPRGLRPLRPALLDASAIAALFDRSQESQARVMASLRSWKGSLVTVEAVIAESCHLLRNVHGAPETILQNGARNVFEIPSASPPRLQRHGAAISEVPGSVDFAGRRLPIHLAGALEAGGIFTLDQDFAVYRWGRNRSFQMLIP